MPLTDRDRREIKKQIGGILGGGPATFASSRIIPAGASGGAIEGTVTLNGKTQPARLQVTDSGSGRYRGSATLAQTGFGIKPYTGFFGALKLRDEVVVEFEVDLGQGGSGRLAGITSQAPRRTAVRHQLERGTRAAERSGPLVAAAGPADAQGTARRDRRPRIPGTLDLNVS